MRTVHASRRMVIPVSVCLGITPLPQKKTKQKNSQHARDETDRVLRLKGGKGQEKWGGAQHHREWWR